MTRRTNRLNVTRLEDRDLMAAGVTAFVSNNTLFVRESNIPAGDQNQAVSILRLSGDTVRVTGTLDRDGVDTVVNGRDSQDFSLPLGGNVNVKLAGGDDGVFFVGGEFNAITVDVGSSNPNHVDADDVFVLDTRTRNGVRIATGGGPDRVVVQRSQIGDRKGAGPETLSIATGSGADQVDVGSFSPGLVSIGGHLVINAFRSVAENEADAVTVVNANVQKSTVIETGGGADALLVDLLVGGDFVAVTGTGDDDVKLNNLGIKGQLIANTSSGNDALDMRFLNATHLTVDGGAGFDKLTSSLPGTTKTAKVIHWETVNGITLPKAGGSVVVPGGGTFGG